ncbi:MAG: 16S rRNA (adenine(1518)-N(6)/adenine(1519)-N(6))-dimethyltransferase RsmA [Ignavibacteria bacterium]|nr:16S rRNA (adenine(1518)-N(6)/adenine(1519)-N(6))-dimethyltransferase RsmA [Ignavibacteria bacterium]
MTEKKIYPKKSLGQNYLVDNNICKSIVDTFNIHTTDHVIEIGPGQGAITKYVLERTKNYTGIELDSNNFRLLQQYFPSAEFLNVDFMDYQITHACDGNKVRFIGNIPYNITTPIVFKLMDSRNCITDAQLMIQEEVALRIAANPNSKEYGIPSVLLQAFSKPELKFKVSKNCFYPKPKVDSRIIYFDFGISKENNIKNIEFFRKFVKTAFSQRRKTLRNSLKSLEIDLNASANGFDFNRRAESLSVDEFITLADTFC